MSNVTKINNHVCFIEGKPHVHIHYLTDDNAAEREGLVELCCHGCHTSTFVRYRLPPIGQTPEPSPVMYSVRKRFEDDHAGCRFPAGAVLCPVDRLNSTTVDLRSINLEKPD